MPPYGASTAFNASPEPTKYVRVNGVARLNPAYTEYMRTGNKSGANPTTTALNPEKALLVVSNKDQLQEINQALKTNWFENITLADSTIATEEILKQPETCRSVGIQGDAIVDELGKIFAKLEAPIGLMNKLMVLSEYDELQFLVDDSGSMATLSDTKDSLGRNQTRWEEAKGRLKDMIEVMAYVPTPKIVIQFLNRRDMIVLEHNGETPERFMEAAYSQINAAFSNSPQGSTPARERLLESINAGAGRKVARYFFCDGEPNGGEAAKAAIAHMVKNRPYPQDNPLTFLSCTSNDEEAEWMKETEELAPYCAEYDDFRSEALEVQYDQGDVLPFTRGFYLIGQLVAAMNPDDLDAMDESVPLTKYTLDNLLGVVSSNEEYRRYFEGFKEAQRKRRITCRLDNLKAQHQWEPYYHEFLHQHLAKNIEGVKRFKSQLLAR